MYRRIITKIKKMIRPVYQINYIIEDANWSIKWDGIYITENINKQFNVKSGIRVDFENIKNQIVHFGSRNIYLPDKYKKLHKSNKVIFTWFHGTEEDITYIKSLPEGSKNADLIHTSCEISKKKLIHWGAEEKKIRVIPLGVDLSIFHSISRDEKLKRRKELGIPEHVILIGSFQKDGEGWGEGLEPKLIKGPDIFCDAVEELAKNYPIYVFLTGPARGYVIKRLETAGIPYQHKFLENYKEIAEYFNILDLYIISSRVEGGPKAVLECLASGVPVISTKVGMCPDIIQKGHNGFIVDNHSEIVKYAEKFFDSPDQTNSCIKNGLKTVLDYDWQVIAKRYYDDLYSGFLN
ncbi:MAG: glycosyltransferase family 4 protein [Spirochaetes bacterium]|nr:glycosyltransferase family 4 protein [Spirochaetota bacterium]